MGMWKTLFRPSRPSLRQVWGTSFVIAKDDVLSLNTEKVEHAIQHAAKQTLGQKRHHAIELAIDGFNDDPRDLYQIPEASAWFKALFERNPDVVFWLSPGSLRLLLLTCIPGTWKQDTNGAIETFLDGAAISPKLHECWMQAFVLLTMGGLNINTSEFKAIADEVASLASDALRGHSLGREYAVVSDLPR